MYLLKSISFESSTQIRNVWKNTSGWNVDRVPANKLKPESKKGPLYTFLMSIKTNVVLLYGQVPKRIVFLLKQFILMQNMINGGKN